MKRLIIYVGFILSLVISFLIGNIYKSQKDELFKEDIMREEFSLMLKYRNQPSYLEVVQNANKLNMLETDNVIIVWKYYHEMNILEKVVINNEFVVAYDKLKVISGNNKCDFIQVSDADSNKL